MQDIKTIFEKQKVNRWRTSQSTASERIAKLKKIRDAIFEHRKELHEVLQADYRKNPAEVDLTEIHPTLADLNHTIKHLKHWMKPHRAGTPLVLFGTRSEVRYEAKGVVLILAPWNYPFQLLMVPLITALAAGNCVMVKPSSKVPQTARFIKKFLEGLFSEEEVAVFEGGPDVADALLELPFDHIFFTGSPPIGKKVMTAAAKHLVPVTLELGGKSPVILDETADLRQAAERIMWGKFINAGQTCVAPDYLLIHHSCQKAFVEEAIKVLKKRYGTSEQEQEKSADFCRLVSDGHFQGLRRILDESVKAGAKIAVGGICHAEGRYISPTLLTEVTDSSPIMQEEIFGPILPILSYRSLDEVFRIIRSREKPLALYIFSNNNAAIESILKNTTAGGTCINSLVIHLANNNLPFGGVGYSGMGNYHGFYGFRQVSHERAILRQGWPDSLKFFYPPYTARVKKMIETAMKYVS